MGLNHRFGDVPTELAAKISLTREQRDQHARARVRSGEMPLDTYLTDFRGYRPEHIPAIRAGFHDAIFRDTERDAARDTASA